MSERMNVMLKTVILKRFGSSLAFSIALGISEVLVSRVIHGRYFLDEAEMKRWAEKLECSPRIFDPDGVLEFERQLCGRNMEW